MKTVYFLFFIFVLLIVAGIAGVISCANDDDDDEAKEKTSNWEFETIDVVDDVGSYNSFVLDSDDVAHVSYFDATALKIKYATNESSTWESEEIPTPQDAAGDNSIGIDSSGTVHIVFCGSGLWYSAGTFGNWAAPTHPEADGGCDNDMAVEDDGTVHISYTTSEGGTTNLIYQVRPGDGSVAQIITVDTGDIGSTAIALDDVGFPFIAFEKGGKLMFAEISGTTWSSKEVDTDSVGSQVDMVLSQNSPRIVYSGSNNLKYAEESGSDWAIETVDNSGNVGYSASIALDSGNASNVGYAGAGAIFFATSHAGEWASSAVVGGLGSADMYATVAVDSKDFIHIVFYNAAGQNLQYAVSKTPNESLDL